MHWRERKSRTTLSRRKSNEQLMCSWQDCESKRRGFYRFCGRHAHLLGFYGHPTGRRIRPEEYAKETREVEVFLHKFAMHDGLIAAKKYLQQWMEMAACGHKVPAYKDMRLLYDYGVSPLTIIQAVLPIFLFARRNPKILPDDKRLTYAISWAVLALTPREKKHPVNRQTGKVGERFYYVQTTKRSREEIGSAIREKLGAFLMQASKYLNDNAAEEEELAAQMRKGFIR